MRNAIRSPFSPLYMEDPRPRPGELQKAAGHRGVVVVDKAAGWKSLHPAQPALGTTMAQQPQQRWVAFFVWLQIRVLPSRESKL